MMVDISLVMTGRNDGYGGDFLGRMRNSLRSFLNFGAEVNIDAEVVVVDWNPPADRESLATALEDLDTGDITVWFITVPPEIHDTIPNSDEIPLFEYVGKNVGIRRSRGEFVLACNPDLLFNRRLVQFLARGEFVSDCFYRARRYDIPVNIDIGETPEEQLRTAAENVFRVSINGSGFVNNTRRGWMGSYLERLKKNRYRPREIMSILGELLGIGASMSVLKVDTPSDLFFTTSGDFLMMSKESWEQMRGFPEVDTNYHVDSLGCLYAMANGLNQITLKGDYRIYHQEHDRSARDSRPTIDWSEIEERGVELLEKDRPVANKGEWGLEKVNLPTATLG